MKRLLFILTALLMASNVMAMRTVVFRPSIDKDQTTGGNVTNGSFTLSKHGVSISVDEGTITNDQYRFFNSINVSLDIDWGTLYEGEYGVFYGRLQSVEFVCVASGSSAYGAGNLDVQGSMPGGDMNYSGNVASFSAEGYNAREDYYFKAESEVRCTEIRVTVYADAIAPEYNYSDALNVSGGNIQFTSSGNYPWITVESGGRTYAQSGNQGIASSSSELTATVSLSQSYTLSFDFKAWGEGTSYDRCVFSIDGVEKFSYGARDNDWESYSVEIPAGSHTLSWSYIKDSSVNPEGDYFAVDNVALRIPLDRALNVNGGNIHFTSTGNYPWITVESGGRTYAQSGNSGIASSSSSLTATISLSQSYNLSFDFKAWGEGSSYDVCVFSVDGVQKFSYGARDNDWETYTVEIPAGNHTLTWTYTKDSSVNPEGDYFAVDNVALKIPLDRALNVSGGNIHFTTVGNYPWYALSEGNRTYAKSGNAGVHNSSSELRATVNLSQVSRLSFDFKAWGEGVNSFYDQCVFSIDGVDQFVYGARDNDWETYTVVIPSGNHTLTWTYSKDGTVHPVGDYFALDNVSITSNSVLRGDVDRDGIVTINDVTTLIDLMLSGNTDSVDINIIDCDGDHVVTIGDVTALIDYLLRGYW